MEKAFAGVIGLVLGMVAINGWGSTPLQVNYGMPQELGEPVSQPTIQELRDETSSGVQTSIFAEYYGSKIGSDKFTGDEKLNGIGAGITFTAVSALNTTIGMNFQKNSSFQNTEINIKGGYKFYNYDNTYANASIGVGYAWIDVDDYDVRLRYITLPVELEVGHYFQKDLATYVGIGYKKLYVEHLKDVCTGYFCGSTASDILDMDGVTYRLGLKYDF